MDFSFNFWWADMANILRRTPVRKAVIFYKRGAVQPDPIRYHGTSFRAMIAISEIGFLPVWGAGRGKALEKFGEDMPVVYTSSVEEQASWYPQAMVDAKGSRVGELVCLGSTPMRVVLICSAAVDKRRIKIRRKCLIYFYLKSHWDKAKQSKAMQSKEKERREGHKISFCYLTK